MRDLEYRREEGQQPGGRRIGMSASLQFEETIRKEKTREETNRNGRRYILKKQSDDNRHFTWACQNTPPM